MSYPFFDTLKYAKLLRNHGFQEHEARGLMSAQILALQSTLRQVATRADLKNYATRMDLLNTERRLENQILTLEKKLDNSVNEMKSYILKNNIFMLLSLVGINLSLFALFQ